MEEKFGDYALRKRRALFERITLFATLMGLFHFTVDLLAGSGLIPLIDLLITSVLFLCNWLHRKGRHSLARNIGLPFLNICFAVYACIIPAEIGIYLFYFPLIAITMAIFDATEKTTRNLFVLLSASLLVALFLTDFDLIGPFEIDAPNVETNFLINLISSTLILIISVGFVLGVNHESERRLKLLADEINAQNLTLEKTNAELDRFFYSTSHDLRSPLLSIKGLVNIARKETRETKTLSYLNMMTDRVDKLDLFVREIIDYSKNARTEIAREEVDIAQLVAGVRDNLQFLEGAEKIQFQSEIQVDRALTDRSRLGIILNNLSSNAVKYHNIEGPNPWIKVSVRQIGNHLCIGVSDNGLGINPDRQAKIFDMFYRGTERSNGSGLGLYIVKETIEKMKGSIAVDSIEGEGSSFMVNLPVYESSTVATPEPVAQQPLE